MKCFGIEQPNINITHHLGLSLVGAAINNHTQLVKQLDAPMTTHLGKEGYCMGFELCEGKQYHQKGTPEFLHEVLQRAIHLTNKPILLRLDSGNDAIKNIGTIMEFNKTYPDSKIDFIIKWNPRKKKDRPLDGDS